MDQLITAFGIDVRLILLQILNFGLLAAGLSYLLYKPVLRLLDERRERVEQGMKDAEAAAAIRATAESEKQSVLTAAQREAEAVALRAKEHAEEKGRSIVTAAEAKAAQLVASATETSEELKRTAQRESEAEIAKAAVLAAEKILVDRTTAS